MESGQAVICFKVNNIDKNIAAELKNKGQNSLLLQSMFFFLLYYQENILNPISFSFFQQVCKYCRNIPIHIQYY